MSHAGDSMHNQLAALEGWLVADAIDAGEAWTLYQELVPVARHLDMILYTLKKTSAPS